MERNPSIGVAADLVTSSFVSGVSNKPEVVEAINYLKENKDKLSTALFHITEMISNTNEMKKKETAILEKESETIDKFRCFIDDNLFNDLIHKIKLQAKENLFGAITWVELARLYSINGQEAKADNAMSIALHIAPNNRFVLRSATRLYIHIGNPDKALFYLRKNEITKHDPWLLSAHIATSTIMDRFSPLSKNGQEVLSSKHFTAFDKTELASSLGTLELKNGSFKKAKLLIDQSLIMPNDNSLAQLEWLSKEDSRFHINPFKFQNVVNPFEAHALDLFNKGFWAEAFKSSLNWYLDLPYSKRPVLLASYIACCITNDFDAAIMLCEVGLKSNPGDPDILNNLVYAYAKANKLEQAENYVKQFISLAQNNRLESNNIITFQATIGLIFFRMGQIEDGKKYYKSAITNAEKANNIYLKNLAIVNFTTELVISNDAEKHDYLAIVDQVRNTAKEVDLLAAIDNIGKLQDKDKNEAIIF